MQGAYLLNTPAPYWPPGTVFVSVIDPGVGTDLEVRIFHEDAKVFEGAMPYVSTFVDVPEGQPLLYMNSVDNLAAAINWGDFAGTHGIGSGPAWRIEVARP